MKVVILKQDIIIDGKEYRKGEVIPVDDNFPNDEIKEVIQEVEDGESE